MENSISCSPWRFTNRTKMKKRPMQYNTIQYNTIQYEYYYSGINPVEFRGHNKEMSRSNACTMDERRGSMDEEGIAEDIYVHMIRITRQVHYTYIYIYIYI